MRVRMLGQLEKINGILAVQVGKALGETTHADGTDPGQVEAIQSALRTEGAMGEVVGPHLGMLDGGVEANKTFTDCSSVLFDAVFVPGGASGVSALREKSDALLFVDEAYKHGKPIGALAEGVKLVGATQMGRLLGGNDSSADNAVTQGVFLGDGDPQGLIKTFVNAPAQHRFVNRKQAAQVAA